MAGPAATADESSASTLARPATEAITLLNDPGPSLGMALIGSQDTRFVDGEDAGHAALHGIAQLFDAGALDDGLQLHPAAGLRLTYRLHAQLELGLAAALDWRGNTNDRNAGEHQPSEARLDTRRLLIAGFHDFPGRELDPGRLARPCLGAGLGSPKTA